MLAFVVWMFMPSSRPLGCRQSAASLTVQSLISLSVQRACFLLPHCKYSTLLIIFRPPVVTATISLFFHVRDGDIAANIFDAVSTYNLGNAPPHTALPSPIHRLMNQTI